MNLVVLGATGSIGRQALEVAEAIEMPVVGLSAGQPSQAFLDLAGRYPEASLAVAGGSRDERDSFAEAVSDRRVDFGPEALAALAEQSGAIVVNGIVGIAGLRPSLAALGAGNRLALANKESLVAAGPLLRAAIDSGGGELIPVDSEHSAIFQSLMGEDRLSLQRIYLTASGGPFRDWDAERLADATPEQALKHPNWQMGRRITVDSATLVNKGLELIEAHQLFDLDYDAISVLIHPQSIIHSMVEMSDGSVKAQMGPPDMRLPVEFALTYPKRGPNLLEPFSWVGKVLTFDPPDLDRFPALALAYQAGRLGGAAPAVYNAADEIAVEAFLQGRIGFTGISRVIASTLESVSDAEVNNLEGVLEVDREARAVAASLITGVC